MAPIKLQYFDLAGRGEPARVLLLIGGEAWEDVRVSFQDWGELKGKTPLGFLPTLQVGDKVLSEATAIDRYLAQRAGLLPSDPWQAAVADQAYLLLMVEVFQIFTGSIWGMSKDDRRKRVEEVGAGQAIKDRLQQLNKIVEEHGKPFLGGKRPSHADAAIFHWVSLLGSDVMEGLPKDLLAPYPRLVDIRNRVASLPAVAQHYAQCAETRAPYYTAWQPAAM